MPLIVPLSHAPSRRAAVVVVTVAGFAGGFIADSADGHTELLDSRPAEGDTLAAAPASLWLLFSAPVETGLTEVRLIAPGGRTIELELGAEPGQPRAIRAAVPPLRPGAYRVHWRVLSADGHPIEGSYVFWIAAESGTAAADTSAPQLPSGSATDPAAEDRGGMASGSRLAGALRGLSDGALMALAGLLAFVAWIVPEGSRRAYGATVALSFLAPLLLAAHLVAWLLYVSPDGTLEREVAAFALSTTTGRIDAARLGLAALAAVILISSRRAGPAAALALLAVAATGAVGHTLTTAPLLTIPFKAIHVVAAALWLGGLLTLILGGLDPAAFRRGAARVSSMALAAVVVIAVTGVLQTFLFLDAPADLLRSDYGRLVLVKAAGLFGLVLFGARNRYRLLPSLTRHDGPERLRRSVSLEVLLMVGVLLAAGFLAYLPPPS
ncbi:MAG TPA: copper resistance protein CopC [Gemmatimonadota bacterium]|nr:copper resistance protein CopC [Gemmatimonadota bacterium]